MEKEMLPHPSYKEVQVEGHIAVVCCWCNCFNMKTIYGCLDKI